MTDSEEDVLFQEHDTWAVDAIQTATTQMSVKIAPPFNGAGSWFAYEQAIDDWVTMTTLDPAKHGPNLKNMVQAEGSRSWSGLFKCTLRKWYIKGNEYI